MTLDSHRIKIEKNLIAYEELQGLHLGILEKDEFPDIETMTQQRNETFACLKTSLDELLSNAGALDEEKSIAILKRFESKIASIMACDDKLATQIKKHQTNIKNNLNHMKQGKAALQGYGSAGKNPRRPSVLSMNR